MSKCLTMTVIRPDTFMTGFIIGLASLKVHQFNSAQPAFYPAMVEAYNYFSTQAPNHGLNARFIFALDKLHGDAPAVKQAYLSAAQRGLISFHEDTIFLNVREEDVNQYMKHLPGDIEIYRETAKVFQERVWCY